VAFLDASGIGALVKIRSILNKKGCRLKTVGATGLIAEVLHLTGVATELGMPNQLTAAHRRIR